MKLKKTLSRTILISSVISIVLLSVSLAIFTSCDKGETITDKFDRFGSFLSGSIGLVIGVVTTILVYLTYQTQKEELKEAREEAKASRKALEEQAEASKKQQLAIQLQQFENTFFNLLTNHREVTKSLSEEWYSKRSEIIIEGKNVISACVTFFKQLFYMLDDYNEHTISSFKINNSSPTRFDWKSIEAKNHNIRRLLEPDGIVELYELIFGVNKSSLSHYFRNLYHLVLFVDEYSGFNNLFDNQNDADELKYKYIRLIRAQLSHDELILLALNSISCYGQGFITLIERYSLLENVNIYEELGEMEGLLEKYPHFAQNQQNS